MTSLIKHLFLSKNKSSIILFMILQVVQSTHTDFLKYKVSVIDCLNADKKDVELFLEKHDEDKKKVLSYRAKYMLSEIFMSTGINVTSNVISNEFYPYHRHQYAVRNTIFTLTHQISVSIMLITTNCQSNTRNQFEILLKNHFVYCYSLNLTDFKPLEIIESFDALDVKMAVMILPRLLTQTFLEIAANFQVYSFIYITVDYEPKMIRDIQEVNPLLEFYNSNLVNASDLSENEMIRRINQTECSLSAGRMLYQDDYQIFVCQHRSPRILQIVTLFFSKDVFRLRNIYPRHNKCEVGLICKIRSRKKTSSNDSNDEWDLICCGGRLIDMLMIVMNDIKIPFSLYIRGDESSITTNTTNAITTWTGLLNDLRTGKADLALVLLAITRDRYKVMDFVFKMSKRTPIAILLRRPDVDIEFLNFPFIPKEKKDFIAYLVLLHLTVILVVYLFEHIAFRQVHGQKYNFKDSWSFVGAILFQRDIGGLATMGWGGRVLAITYACAMTVLISSYTATLTAKNIDDKDIPEFKGLRDKMFQDPSKRVGFARYSSHERLVNKYRHKSQRINVLEYEKAAKKLTDKELDAIIGSLWYLERALVSDIDYCKHLMLHIDEIETEDLAWGYKDNSKFGNLISLSILRLVKTESLAHIEEKWEAVSSCNQKRPKAFPWQYAGGLIICLLVTIGACFIILVSETIFILLRKRKANNYSVSSQK